MTERQGTGDPDRSPTLFAILVRHARIRAGLTQQQLADACGISLRTVTNYETGKSRPRSSDRCERLFAVLRIRPDDLRGESEGLSFLHEEIAQIFSDSRISEYEKDLLMYRIHTAYWSSKGISQNK